MEKEFAKELSEQINNKSFVLIDKKYFKKYNLENKKPCRL